MAYGIFSFQLGFYLDDWVFLEAAARGRGLWGSAQALARGCLLWTRPLEIGQFALLYAFGGHQPAFAHVLIALLAAAEAVLLFRFWESLLGRRELALTAACLTVLAPNRTVLHVWPAASPALAAQVLMLAGLLVHLRWLKQGGRTRILTTMAFYLASFLCYEATAFMPILLAVPAFRKARQAASRPVWALAQAAYAFLPFAVALAAALAWQWHGAAALLHQSNPKSQGLALSLGHVLRAYGAGAECVTNRLLHICWRSLGPAWRELPLLALAGLVAAAAVLAWLLAAGKQEALEPVSAESSGLAVWATVACGFIAAYAPYALSGSYMPQIYGVMSRTNCTGAWVAGLGLAAGLAALRRGPRRLVLGGLIMVFTMTTWLQDRRWAQAWGVEQKILAKIGPVAASLPSGARVTLTDAPHFVGEAVVFDAGYDFDAALRLVTGRPDLSGEIEPAARGAYRYSYSRDALTQER
jgi:hypothetical protein